MRLNIIQAGCPDGLFGASAQPVQFSRSAPTIDRLIDATANNLPEVRYPGQDNAEAIARIATRTPRARKVALKLAKIAAATATGAYGGYQIRRSARAVKIGAAGGALAGLLFQDPRAQASVNAGLNHAAKYKSISL